MGAKDWMLIYADGPVPPMLRSPAPLDRAAAAQLVETLYPGQVIAELADGCLAEDANPPRDEVFAACLDGLTILCTEDAALGRPSMLDGRFLKPARDRTTYLHAMHSVVDWFAYAVWEPGGRLRRALSVSPESGVIENLGPPLPFEQPYWAGERPVELDEDLDDRPYPLPFHPLELAEDALRNLFGFNFEGRLYPEDPDKFAVELAGFRIRRKG